MRVLLISTAGAFSLGIESTGSVRSNDAEGEARRLVRNAGTPEEVEVETPMCASSTECAVEALRGSARLLGDPRTRVWTKVPELAPWAAALADPVSDPEDVVDVDVTLIRHGFSCANANSDIFGKRGWRQKAQAKLWNGVSYRDPPLTDCGVATSVRAGRHLAAAKPEGFHLVGASSLRRAIETAAGEFDGSGPEVRWPDGAMEPRASPSDPRAAQPAPRIAVLPFFLEGSPGEDNKPNSPAEQLGLLQGANDVDANPTYKYLEEAQALYELGKLCAAAESDFEATQKAAHRDLGKLRREYEDHPTKFRDAEGTLHEDVLDSWFSGQKHDWYHAHIQSNRDQTMLRVAKPVIEALVERSMPKGSRNAGMLDFGSTWKDDPSMAHAESFLGTRVVPDLRRVLPHGEKPRLAIVSHSLTIKDYIHEGHVKDLPLFRPCRELLKDGGRARKPLNNEAITVTYKFDPAALTLVPHSCVPTIPAEDVEALFGADHPIPGVAAEPTPLALNAEELHRCGSNVMRGLADEVEGGKCIDGSWVEPEGL